MKRDYLYLGVIGIIIVIMFSRECQSKKVHKQEIRNQAQSAASLLQDTLEKIVSRKDTYYVQTFSELTPEAIKASDLYGELNYEKQLLLAELARYKNIIASMQTKYTGNKVDTITQYIRIPVLKPFFLSWLDTSGGFTYTDTVYVDSAMVSRKFTPQLRFTHDVRIIDNGKKGISGEVRVIGLEEFDLTGQNVYAFFQPTSPADVRKKKLVKTLKWVGVIGSNALSFYAGTQVK